MGEHRATAVVLLLAALAFLAFAYQDRLALGPYYDEAFLAQQARDFVTPESAGQHPPGVSDAEIGGRRFPLRNAAYLGALKSQLAIPLLWIFGDDLGGWRLATVVTSLLAVLTLFFWARRCFGTLPASLGILFLLADPSLYFFSLYEWGPFTTLLLCRGLGFWLLCYGWEREDRRALIMGGIALGLGVFCRADFALIVAAAGLGAMAARPDVLRAALTERRGDAALAIGAAVFAGLPMLFSLEALLATSQGIADRGGLDYKAQVLWSTLDGSHFYRVIDWGGRFDEIFRDDAPFAIFGVTAALAWSGLAAADWRNPSPGRRFLVVTAPLLALLMWLPPGAVRAHHSLNLMPLAHLLLGLALATLWERRDALARGAAAALGTATLLSFLYVSLATHELIEATGGRGRFSDAIQKFAASLDERGDVVSLDWGFHEPLLFLSTRGPNPPRSGQSLEEPIWQIAPTLSRGQPWVRQGDAQDIYLVHARDFDLFGMSAPFLRAARRLEPKAEIESFTDRSMSPGFLAVRIPFAHRLAFNGEAFFISER